MLLEEERKELETTLPPILNIPDICSILQVSPSTIRRELHRKDGLQGYLADGEWNIARADFLEYLAHNATL